MNQAVVPPADRLENKEVIEVPDRTSVHNVKCTPPLVHHVVKLLRFLSNLVVIDRSIAGTAIHKKEIDTNYQTNLTPSFLYEGVICMQTY